MKENDVSITFSVLVFDLNKMYAKIYWRSTKLNHKVSNLYTLCKLIYTVQRTVINY